MQPVPGGRAVHLPGHGASEALGPRLLVEYAPVGRHLVAVVLDGGRCRLFELAPLAEVREAVAGLRLALRTALDADPPTEDQPALREAAADVQRLVLGPLGLPPGREVVIVPDGPVLPTPWALLPDLATATVVVAASVRSLWRPASRPRPVGESQGRRPGRPGPAPRRGGDRGGGRALGRGGRGAKGRRGQRGRGHERHEPR